MTRTSHPAAALSKSVHHRLNMYALTAASTGAGMLAAQPAQAKIVYTPAHLTISDKMILDLNHDGINDFWFHSSLGNNTAWGWSDLTIARSQSGNKIAAAAGGRASAIAFRAGDRIGGGKKFESFASMAFRKFPVTSTGSVNWYGQWGDGGKGLKNRYLGLKFMIAGKVHFGWARVTVTVGINGNKYVTGTLTGYAYETIANKAIVAGKTKGPDVITVPAETGTGALGQLALGRK